jgi:hypothetical protein
VDGPLRPTARLSAIGRQKYARDKPTVPPSGATWNGETRMPNALSKDWSETMDALGLTITLHALRHTHASQLIAAGMDVLAGLVTRRPRSPSESTATCSATRTIGRPPFTPPFIQDLERGAVRAGLRLHPLMVDGPGEFEDAFAAMRAGFAGPQVRSALTSPMHPVSAMSERPPPQRSAGHACRPEVASNRSQGANDDPLRRGPPLAPIGPRLLRTSPAIAGREHFGAIFFHSYRRYFCCYFAANTDRLRYEGGNGG